MVAESSSGWTYVLAGVQGRLCLEIMPLLQAYPWSYTKSGNAYRSPHGHAFAEAEKGEKELGMKRLFERVFVRPPSEDYPNCNSTNPDKEALILFSRRTSIGSTSRS